MTHPVVQRDIGDPTSSEVSVSAIRAGRCEVHGVLTFASARRAYEAGIQALSASTDSKVELDCSGVRAADSAGLAVLLAWLAYGRKHGRQLTYSRLPEAIVATARISDVEEMLGISPSA